MPTRAIRSLAPLVLALVVTLSPMAPAGAQFYGFSAQSARAERIAEARARAAARRAEIREAIRERIERRKRLREIRAEHRDLRRWSRWLGVRFNGRGRQFRRPINRFSAIVGPMPEMSGRADGARLHLSIDGPNEHSENTEELFETVVPMSDADSVITLYPVHTGQRPFIRDGRPINGGIPQLADLDAHARELREDIRARVPEGYTGIVCLAYEDWRPVWDWWNHPEYHAMSMDHARDVIGPSATEEDAARLFEEAAREFMTLTLDIAKEERPEATWGWYNFPVFFRSAEETVEEAADKLAWAKDVVDVAMPNIYASRKAVTGRPQSDGEQEIEDRRDWIDHRLSLAEEIGLPIVPYTRLRYHKRTPEFAHDPISANDLMVVFAGIQDRVDGWIVWDYVEERGEANELSAYIRTVVGPFARTFLVE